MNLKSLMTILTVCTLLTTGCSFNNPFADSNPSSEDQKQSKKNNNEQNSQNDNNSKDQNGKEDKQQTDEKEDPSNNQPNLPSLEETVTVAADGTKVVTNVNDSLVLVNKKRNLPAAFVPKNLTIPNVPFPFKEDVPKKKLQGVAAKALEEMFAKAKEDNIPLFAQSGYRSYDRQEAIFASNVQQDGEEKANKFSAHPGQSEHQTGLAMDVTSPAVNFELIEKFGETKAGKWVKQHAHEFGFIIRYPEGKSGITGYQYEPWHLRYVGKEHAKRIHEQNVTLEEYMGVDVEQVNASK
ncbi:M15 family metallopeptidase [Pseudalkalibacillus decolorationis]|uniref:M15 family metallopeptidase n=1 Tax=Pseudalkalibacillus decolorationis TaxID=163879 RepID=UPI002147E79E|nr:M15 family metallopeptidase [Pseudalkalibacillus decolorationis]